MTQDVNVVVNDWLNELKSKRVEFSEDPVEFKSNINLLVGFVGNQFKGSVSKANLDSAAKALWAVLKFKKGFEMSDPRAAEKDRADRLKKKELMNALGMGGHKTELDRDDDKDDRAKKNAAKKTQLTEEQLEAKADFEHICNIYSCTRAGRTDHAKTGERREKLRQIIAKKGDRILYTEMLKLANEMLHRFEAEDSKRIY